MRETYLEKKARIDAMEEEKNHIIFGLMGGTIQMIVGALNWLTAAGAWEVVCVCVAALGLLLVLPAIVVPAFLKYPYKAFRFFGNTMGKVIFAVILTALYCLFVLPVGLVLRRNREAQGYLSWEQESPEPRSLFADIDRSATQKTGRASYFGIVHRLLAVFAANRKFILIPIVIILVIVGLVLFLVSANVVTGFIYTIF